MPRGGKRPGAGAPRGNMNNLKHGLYSKQFAQVGALLASDPKVRQALLDLARKHNLKQQKANEVAALLFTRMYQRAENIAASHQPPTTNHQPLDRLNLALPADDLDSIKDAAAKAALRQIRTALRTRAQKSKKSRVNQTPDTTPKGQSKPLTTNHQPLGGAGVEGRKLAP